MAKNLRDLLKEILVSEKQKTGKTEGIRLIFKLKNLFFRTQLCEKCGRDLLHKPAHGFEQLEHCGMGRYKICPECKKIFYL